MAQGDWDEADEADAADAAKRLAADRGGVDARKRFGTLDNLGTACWWLAYLGVGIAALVAAGGVMGLLVSTLGAGGASSPAGRSLQMLLGGVIGGAVWFIVLKGLSEAFSAVVEIDKTSRMNTELLAKLLKERK